MNSPFADNQSNKTWTWMHTSDGVAFLLLCAGSMLISAGFELSGSDTYRFIFGKYSPFVVTAVVCMVGIVAMAGLDRSGWFKPTGLNDARWGQILVLGVALPAPMIVVDWLGGFPKGINVPAPESLLFYPAIGVVAELAFHIVPLGLMAWFWSRRKTGGERFGFWLAIAVSVLIEPFLQVIWGEGQSPRWASISVGCQLLLFNMISLYIFRHRGFLALYMFRLSYYAVWHVGWGHVRLGLLFGNDA